MNSSSFNLFPLSFVFSKNSLLLIHARDLTSQIGMFANNKNTYVFTYIHKLLITLLMCLSLVGSRIFLEAILE